MTHFAKKTKYVKAKTYKRYIHSLSSSMSVFVTSYTNPLPLTVATLTELFSIFNFQVSILMEYKATAESLIYLQISVHLSFITKHSSQTKTEETRYEAGLFLELPISIIFWVLSIIQLSSISFSYNYLPN